MEILVQHYGGLNIWSYDLIKSQYSYQLKSP